MAPEKGGWSHSPSAGTTSWWLMSTMGSPFVLPFQRKSRLPSMTVFSRSRWTRGNSRSSSLWKARNFSVSATPAWEVVSHCTMADSFWA